MKIFDGHNDALLRIHTGRDGGRGFLDRSEDGHVDLPRARAGGLAGGIFAVFVPNPPTDAPEEAPPPTQPDAAIDLKAAPTLPPPLSHNHARQQADAMIALFHRTINESEGGIVQATDVATLESHLDNDARDAPFVGVLHFEGAEPIDPSLDALEHDYREAGLRSLGITWSRPNAFGHGVPFMFPGSPDIGPGLTDAGRQLVRACNELGILIDLSHLNLAGFDDVAELTDAPLVATHSNAHSLCPAARNLTDEQLNAIGQTNGLVGINYAVVFLREDGRNDADTPLDRIADHLAYIADRIGVEHVALGSDFDGARIPHDLADAAGLPRLMQTLRERGFTEDELQLITHGNWLRVLRATWR